MKKTLLVSLLVCGFAFVNAQTLAELEALKTSKKEQIDNITKEVEGLTKQINDFPGWRKGAFGVIGGSLSSFNNWYAQGTPNNNSGNIGFTLNAFANKIEPKFFWRNSLATNLNWIKLDDKDNAFDSDKFNPTTDVFTISSLYGRNITKTLAASILAEYRTTILNNFNDPGYLDLGVGGTWTPNQYLVVVFHPLNYNFVFSSGDTVFESSLGCKIVADYTREIGDLKFKSNLSLFQSYKSNNYSSWAWTNSLAYSVWKNLGVGLDFGFRNSRQEALNYALKQTPPTASNFEDLNNKLQSFYTFGLSYKF